DKITVKKSPQLSLIVNVKNGSGHYKVILSDRFHSVRTIDSTVNLILVLPAKGSFNIKIIDKADPQCLTVDTTYEVAGIFHQPYSIKEGMSLVAIRAVQAQSMPIIGRVNALPLLCLTRVYPSFRAGGISRDNALC
ncbi:MAG TPA: hypothetical protein VD794_00425, partial [Flavisolibacter sp.]|nr:hypothetical protein [Flavisolibacter sp.]